MSEVPIRTVDKQGILSVSTSNLRAREIRSPFDKLQAQVIARLRATRRASPTELEELGRATGRLWACLGATVDELDRLASFDFDHLENSIAACSAGDFLLRQLNSRKFAGTNDAFWQRWSDSLDGAKSAREIAFVQGFAEAAMEVWNCNKDRVMADD
jgi:hypothetical protein